jgi:hypothetical protein
MISIFFKSLENDFPFPAAVDRSRVCACVTSRPTTAQVCIPSCEMRDQVSIFAC